MKIMSKFYITSTLPYVNSDPHIGFALELVQADVIARYHRQKGDEVLFNTGTDEHGLKIYRRALEEGKTPQAFVDEYAAKFQELVGALNVNTTHFIRTSDPKHKAAAQEFWRRCKANGTIYMATYHTKYCVGCELEKTDSELEDGRCPIHPNLTLEEIDETNYFFKFSAYEKALLELYENRPDFVVPANRLNEIKSFVSAGLRDFSISRLKEKLPWGVPVPDDPDHVFFVWFDALVNYISTLGWPEDEQTFFDYWPGVQIAGKDNLRQQSAMWQAMLMAAGLPPSKKILIHGFITVGGQKMSKSLGNVVDPFELVNKYGTDAVRYYLLREIPSGEDGDFGYEKFEQRYNADLANGLGNLVARITALGVKAGPFLRLEYDQQFLLVSNLADIKLRYEKNIESFRLNEALVNVWEVVAVMDRWVNERKPWTHDAAELKAFMETAAHGLLDIALLLDPFLPTTAEKIRERISKGSAGVTTRKGDPLFPRLS